MPSKTYRAAVIGSTNRGNHGHGLDTAFLGNERIELVAVADDNAEGLQATAKRLGVTKPYSDFRRMLAEVKPNLVSIGPRWVDQRVAMVTAAAEAGAHIYCEKPLAGSLADADAMLSACEKAGVKMAVAHQFRAAAPVRKALKNVAAGKYGPVVRMHARPKDDGRGGGEELIVHGTHLFDLMIAVAGPPRWVNGHVAVGARDATRADRREATEPLGPVAGDSIAATFGFDRGVRGFFDSTADLHRADRPVYGLLIECAEAMLHVRSPGDVYIYAAGALVSDNPKLTWEKLWIEDWHFHPDHTPRPSKDWIDRGNRILVSDLLTAIETNREPTTGGAAARGALEMIQGVYASHFASGARLPLPLQDRAHPLGTA